MDTGVSMFPARMVDGMANPKCDWKNNFGDFLCSRNSLAWINSLEATAAALTGGRQCRDRFPRTITMARGFIRLILTAS